MEGWLELIIFAVVIIANIIGGIVKMKQKQKAANNNLPPVSEKKYKNMSPVEKEYSKKTDNRRIAAEPAITAFPDNSEKKTADYCTAAETPQIVNTNEQNDKFDYGEFMRTHGKEALILSEIVLHRNSRRGTSR